MNFSHYTAVGLSTHCKLTINASFMQLDAIVKITGDEMYRRERCIDPTGEDFANGYLEHATSICAPFPLTITQCVKRCSEYEAEEQNKRNFCGRRRTFINEVSLVVLRIIV